MKKFKIIKCDRFSNYELEDVDGKKYQVNINFMDIDKPICGTIIYIQESVLKEKVSLNYGPVEKDKDVDENELIVLSYDNNKIYLERFYG